MEKNFKKTAKKVADKACDCTKKGWGCAKRYFDLKEQLMAPWVIPFLQAHLSYIYLVGLIVLGVWAVIVIGTFDIYAIIVRLAIVSLAFIVFRTLCEIVAACPTEEKVEVKAPKAKKAEKAAKATTPVKTDAKAEKVKKETKKPAKKAKKSSKRKAKKAKKAPVKKEEPKA